MMIEVNDYYWVAIYTKSRAEKKLSAELSRMGIEHYLPLVKTKVQWSDRVKTVEKVLISGYVFAYISEAEYYEVLNLQSAVAYVRSEGKAARIRDDQIQSMKVLLQDAESANLEDLSLSKGQRVNISYGSFKGFEGEVVTVKNNAKLIIRIEQLGMCVTLEVPASHIS